MADTKGSASPKKEGILCRVSNYLSWLYLQYLLNTALYMLEPWERALFNTVAISLISMAVYTTYVFMPTYTKSMLAYFGYVNDSDLADI